jgi:thiol-disulfide isomerase/thioredoxin
MVYAAAPRNPKPPAWYESTAALVFTVTLVPPAEPNSQWLLAPDGVEVQATNAGSVSFTLGKERLTLAVRRLPESDGEESSLEIFFRDGTNGKTTYPGGRFVSLEPVSGNRYRLDFNRARNPFCAYSSVFACPAPWRGNATAIPIEAGERYTGPGLKIGKAGTASPGWPSQLASYRPSLEQTQSDSSRFRAALVLAGGALRFEMNLTRKGSDWHGGLCNGPVCESFSSIRQRGDSMVFEMADYDATITGVARGDSILGFYRNVGNRGPRVIPFWAVRGSWEMAPAPKLTGSWDATFTNDGRTSPRVLVFRPGARGIEMNYLANSGDYGLFWGGAVGDSVDVSHFDGAFVYRLTARLDGDTLRGVFHAGLRTQTRFTAIRSTGRRHLTPPNEVTRADTLTPFRFSFPDVDGRLVTNEDPRFRNKVVLVDIFGSWCPTCHDAAPVLAQLYRDYKDRGFEIVGLAYEVTGDSAIDNRQIRRFREKFGITWTLLRAGLNVVEATAATLPQLDGFTAYPTSLFLGRDGRIRRIHAGFIGPAVPTQHQATIAEFRRTIEALLSEPGKASR